MTENSIAPKRILKLIEEIASTVLASVISAFALHIFVYKNGFAPSGIDGIATMIQELYGWNAGIVSLVINIPLLAAAWFVLNKKYVVYTLLFTVLTAVQIKILASVQFYQFVADSDKILIAILSGLLLGIRTGIMLKIGSSSGGIDVVACIFQLKAHHINIERIISVICYLIAGCSFFVYHDLNSVLLSIVQMFVFEKGVDLILKDNRDAVKFEIVTNDPESFRNDVTLNLKHGATLINTKGMYTDRDSYMIVTIINSRQIPEFLKILNRHPDAFVYYSDVKGIKGNFRWLRDDVAK